MNNTFNFARFGKLFRKYTVETYRIHLMSALVLCGILSLFYGFTLLTFGTLRPGHRFTAMAIIYMLAGSVFTSSIYSAYAQKSQAIVALSLPASHFEKFLIGWLYSLVIYTVVFGICFTLVDYVFVMLTNVPDGEKALIKVMPDENFLYVAFYTYAFLHSILLYGAINFNGMHFIKTACWFFFIIAILCVMHFSLQKSLIANEILFSPPFIGGLKFKTESFVYQNVMLEKFQRQLYVSFVLIGFTSALWTATYFRFREKQV